MSILVCAFGASWKQIFWVLFTSEQECPVVAAIMIGVFNTVFNSINAMLSLWAWSSAAVAEPLSSTFFILGIALFSIGVFFEQYSEIQRKRFKSDPANKGKPFAGGLFSVALNINYGGYTLWRAGYAMVAAGWIWGGFIGVFFFYDFYARALPILDKYCIERVSSARFRCDCTRDGFPADTGIPSTARLSSSSVVVCLTDLFRASTRASGEGEL